MICDICNIIEQKRNIIYEDDDVVGFLSDKPRAVSEILVAPKKHFVVLEEVDDLTLGKIGNVTNLISKAIFEALRMDGTNILISNGVDAGQKIAHFCVSLLPRKQGDMISLGWQGTSVSDESLEETANVILFGLSQVEEKKGYSIEEATPKTSDYITKRLRRLP